MKKTLLPFLKAHSTFDLVTHVDPDGDGIGSMVALGVLLEALGKKVRLVLQASLSERFEWLNVPFEVGGALTGEALIALDVQRAKRLGFQLPNNSACIDHHVGQAEEFAVAWIDPTCCATGQMVYQLFVEFGIPLTLKAAEALYTAIVCDTGRFSYSNTNEQAHQIAQACIERGVNPDRLNARLFRHLPLSQAKIFARVLERMEICLSNRVAVQTLRMADCGEELLEVDYLHDFNKAFEEVECVVLLRECPGGQVRISLRSREVIDAGQLMRRFGGGGHKRAAGGLFFGSLDQAKAHLVRDLEKALEKDINNFYSGGREEEAYARN